MLSRFVISGILCGLVALTPVMSQTSGDFHNDGVEYILDRLPTIPQTEDTLNVVGPLVEDYAASVGQVFDAPEALSGLDLFFPLDPHLFVDGEVASHVSPDLTAYLHLTLDTINAHTGDPANIDLPGLNLALDDIETQAQMTLSGYELEGFLAGLSVARSSASLWADPAQGGRGALQRLAGIIGIDPSLQFTIGWNVVIGFDFVGHVYGYFVLPVLMPWLPPFWTGIFVAIFFSIWIVIRFLWIYWWLWWFL